MKCSQILLVDDDPVLRDIVSGFLRQQGATVTTAVGVIEANEALKAGAFDLIISDVHLPGNSRLQWTEQLLADPEAPPLVLITGNPEVESAMRAANLPVAGYLAKPLEFAQLAELAHHLVSSQQRRRELRALADQAAHLLADSREDDPARVLLQRLTERLGEQAAQPARATARPAQDERWASAIVETIAVLEKTKHSFRSKDLGQLRVRLQALLRDGSTDGASALRLVS